MQDAKFDLFDCLTEEEKARGKRKGIRAANIENFIARTTFGIKLLKSGRKLDKNIESIIDVLLVAFLYPFHLISVIYFSNPCDGCDVWWDEDKDCGDCKYVKRGASNVSR